MFYLTVALYIRQMTGMGVNYSTMDRGTPPPPAKFSRAGTQFKMHPHVFDVQLYHGAQVLHRKTNTLCPVMDINPIQKRLKWF